jgi:hypothetical protein
MDIREQAVTGVIPPQVAEARIREAWPSVSRFGGVAMTRYTLTNRRLMVRKGWGGKVAQEVPLSDIDDVRVSTDANSAFFRAGTIDVVRQGQVALSLAGIPEPDAFRHAIINACTAWVPGKAKTLPFIPASAVN